ncbi:serine/threonine-protein kinase [Nonomuraea sp. B12E4]|uniref:serine/threonine-protein kinase n=1 Tax=Nonomuraea sp. B12E4 TaxID=3153564 RepID=UPI00325F71D9
MAHVEPLREDDPAAVGIYRLLGRLGAGGQGTVYLGQAPDGRQVAVKVLRGGGAGFADRFDKEIAAARRVEPFCIAQVLDASPGEQPYIVTEYVEGPSLQQAGRHTGADLQRLAVATATALTAIHQAGVVHRDFKPANVLLGPGGPRVIDFGIARAMDDAMTHTSSIVGTPAYMAPEQLAGQAVGAPADVFAWASVMVWAANETPPFGSDTLPAIINRILHNEPQLGDLPHTLRPIVYACLVKDPAARPTMRDVLLGLLNGQNPAPHPQQQPMHVQGWGQAPGPGPMGGLAMPGPGVGPMGGPGGGPMGGPMGGPGAGGVPGARRGGRRRSGASSGVSTATAVGIGLSGVLVATLVGGAVWLAPWSERPGASSAAASASPSPQSSSQPVPTRSETKPPRKRTHKPTRTPTKSQSPEPTVTSSPTHSPARTTKRPTPTRTTQKPATSAKVSILPIELFEGPGHVQGTTCLMPPVHFQGQVESSRPGVWIKHAWDVDGKTVFSSTSWVPRGEYTAPVSSHEYMLEAGPHTVTLRVTSPGTARRSLSFDVCAMETW